MKRFLITIAVAFAALCSAPVYAADGLNTTSVSQAGFDKLSESQKAEILKQIAAQAHDTSAAGIAANVTPSKVSEWVDIGTKIGQMMGGAAKEVGVQVNDFVKTPVGQWTMALIVWKFMGGVAVHAFGALLVISIGIPFILWLSRRYSGLDVTYDPEKKDMFGRSVKLRERRREWTDGDVIMFAFFYAIVTAASLICLFTF